MNQDNQDFESLRTQLGLTQQGAADILRVTVRTVRNWEVGHCRVPYAAIFVLETILREKSK